MEPSYVKFLLSDLSFKFCPVFAFILISSDSFTVLPAGPLVVPFVEAARHGAEYIVVILSWEATDGFFLDALCLIDWPSF